MQMTSLYRVIPLATILLANLIPLFQVLWGEWTIVQIVLLFWIETVLIVVLSVALMIWPIANQKKIAVLQSASIGFALPFMLAQGAALLVTFLLVDVDGVILSEAESFNTTLGNASIWWALLVIAASHVFDLYQDLQHNGCNRAAQHVVLQTQLIARVCITQVVLIIGTILAVYLRQALWILLTLILVKIVIDLLIYFLSHREKISGGEIFDD